MSGTQQQMEPYDYHFAHGQAVRNRLLITTPMY
jgi:hypothetical protein